LRVIDMELHLEDNTVWKGFGNGDIAGGEVVFTTASCGYPQAVTDPSFAGQILVFAFPMIGNYGTDLDFLESERPWARAVLVSDREDDTDDGPAFGSWLSSYRTPLIEGVDTRSLVLHLRSKGAMQGVVVPVGAPAVFLRETEHPVARVSVEEPKIYDNAGPVIAVVDYGLKEGILRELLARGARIVRLPHDVSASEILSWKPAAVLLGNGPGDPALLTEQISAVRDLLGELPIWGVCLGLQILALACGASTEKLPFGHRGANHAVMDVFTGKGFLTSQNHGYAVVESSLENTGLSVTHKNLGDGSVEGLCGQGGMVRGVQYHPEGSPGPRDGNVFFDQFMEVAERGRV